MTPGLSAVGCAFTRFPEAADFSMAAMTVALDGVCEVGHGVGPVVEVCRERCVGAPDVGGGRAFQAGQRGPFVRQRRRGSKFGGLVPPACSGDGQGIDLGAVRRQR
jgi:hypothetical protein